MAVKPLPAMQQAFVEEYLKDLNATQAAIRAGYCKNKPSNADKVGPNLLGKPGVAEAIQQGMDARAKRTQVDSDFTMKRLAWLADANIKDVAKWGTKKITRHDKEGHSYEEERSFLEVLSSDVIENSKAYGIDSIRIKDGELSIKMRTPTPALDMIAKHLGLLTPSKSEEANEALSEALAILDEEEKEANKLGKATSGKKSSELKPS